MRPTRFALLILKTSESQTHSLERSARVGQLKRTRSQCFQTLEKGVQNDSVIALSRRNALVAGSVDGGANRLIVTSQIETCKLDEAEAAARDLLDRFPDVHDGWDRLGMVHEARCERAQAADCCRKVIEVIRKHASDCDPAFETVSTELIDRLTAPTAT